MDFLNQLKTDTEIVENWLYELSPKGDGYHSIIFESATLNSVTHLYSKKGLRNLSPF